MSNFNPLTNFNRVRWKETLWLNFLRAVCVLPVLIGFTIVSESTDSMISALYFMIMYPFFYLIVIAPILVLVRAIWIVFLGRLAWIPIIPISLIFIAGGDPIMFLLKKIKPELVPLKQYPFICLDVAMFVLKD
ncbi:MAG: hypothetical protein BRC36_08575 [Cyanobacteria bacterium QH_2_48_84]|jgi:hypothetical protein|nr:MAG: hypothetical protein BRC36_08575 [Cyanobacteria bacterium QH_2_48_84]